jgi:hypothetical protein
MARRKINQGLPLGARRSAEMCTAHDGLNRYSFDPWREGKPRGVATSLVLGHTKSLASGTPSQAASFTAATAL